MRSSTPTLPQTALLRHSPNPAHSDFCEISRRPARGPKNQNLSNKENPNQTLRGQYLPMVGGDPSRSAGPGHLSGGANALEKAVGLN